VVCYNLVICNAPPKGAELNMEGPESTSVTALLHAWSQGDASALEKLTPLWTREKAGSSSCAFSGG